MDQKAEGMLTRVLYLAYSLVFIFTLIQNFSSPWPIVFLSGILLCSITIRNAIMYQVDKYINIGRLTLVLDIAIVSVLLNFDKSQTSMIYYLILIGDASIYYSYSFSLGYTLLCYISYIIVKFLDGSAYTLNSLLPGIFINSISFISVFLIMNLVKYEIKQRKKLSETMFELKIKSKQLQSAYIKLKKTSEELEELTITKERNRIAREIHDTVGHTLTTVLLEMELCERLLKPEPQQALERLQLAKGQVRKGLKDIRESVRTLQSGRELLDFGTSLRLLIEETTKHGNIYIKYEIAELPTLKESYENVIYRALQEGLTNGIKHGKSTAFVFILDYDKDKITFSLQDNGVGTDNINPSFGLGAMEERVKEVGGTLSLSSTPGEGFNINISIPVRKEAING